MRNTGSKVSSEMDCTRAAELFFDIPEEEWSQGETAALRSHETSCARCRQEFAEWRWLRSVLRGQEFQVHPPVDFTAGVMTRIQELTAAATATPRHSLWLRFKNSLWGKGIAAAAVILAILTGSLSLANRTPLQVAHHLNLPGFTKILRPNHPPANQNNQHRSPGLSRPGSTREQQQEIQLGQAALGSTPGSGKAAGEAPGSRGKPSPEVSSPGAGPGPSATPPAGEGKMFLNKTRVITTSTLRLEVPDLEQARSKALQLAVEAGGRLTADYATRDNGRPTAILRLTLPAGGGQPYASQVGGLGSVVMQESSQEDVTREFATTLKEYQTLKAEQSTRPEGEKQQLESQISFLENQLESWDEESEKEVVILILVQR